MKYGKYYFYMTSLHSHLENCILERLVWESQALCGEYGKGISLNPFCLCLWIINHEIHWQDIYQSKAVINSQFISFPCTFSE